MKRLLAICGTLLLFSATSTVQAGEEVQNKPLKPKVRVMVIGGQNNHDWKKSTPYLNDTLNRDPHIEATIVNAPSDNNDKSWRAWKPRFADYDVVLLDYNGKMWPDRIRSDFEDYIRKGGSAIVIHAANNSFTGWSEFESMVGLLWRGRDFGRSLYVDEQGETVRVAPGIGRKMGHGGIYDWTMTTRDRKHPVTKGMPLRWMHCRDELYHGQRGPAKNVNILLTAFSDPKQGGTGKHEPIVWWVPYGKGKVVTNVMGHVGHIDCLECVGFQTILTRSAQWLATGGCTTKISANFPTENAISKVKLTDR